MMSLVVLSISMVILKSEKESYTPKIFVFFFFFLFNYNVIWQDYVLFLGCSMDSMKFSLIFLSVFCVFSIAPYIWYGGIYKEYSWNMVLTLFVILMWFFITDKLIYFYMLFELSLIPVFLLVAGVGYQLDRAIAVLWMFFYTVVASVPMLIIILFLKENFFITNFSSMLYNCSFFNNMSLEINLYHLALISGFGAKFPIYGAHLWLPRAHVEAPLMGSVILAAVMLKLAGYGLYVFSCVLNSFYMNLFIKYWCLSGGVLVSLRCIGEKDMKKLIAYTSVAHMGFVIYGMMDKSWFGIIGAQLFMLAHGVCSSGLFVSAYLMGGVTGSRSLLFNSGFLSRFPSFSIFMFLMCLGNMSGPPTSNFFAEIFCMISMISKSFYFLILLFFLTFLSVGYSMILYSSSQYGRMTFYTKFTLMFSEYTTFIYLSFWIFFMNIFIGF